MATMWSYNKILFSPEDGGAGGTGSGGGTSSGEPKGSSQPDTESAAVPAWAEKMSGTQAQMAEALRTIVQLAQQSQPKRADPDEDLEEPDDDTPADLELLSRADLVKHIVTQVERAVDKNVVKPLTEQLQALRRTTTVAELSGAVKELRATHKDFDEWKTEMLDIAKENTSLPPHRLYKLARAENPDKAAKLDKKYAPPSDAPPKIRFGGLTPGQSGTGSRARNMNGHDAAEAAWQDLSAALGEPIFGEE